MPLLIPEFKEEVLKFPLTAIGINGQLLDAYGWEFKVKRTFIQPIRYDPALIENKKEFSIKSTQEGFSCLFFLYPKSSESLEVKTFNCADKTLAMLCIDLNSTNIKLHSLTMALSGCEPTGLDVAKVLKACSDAHNC